MNKNWFIGIDVSKKTLDASIFVAGEVINRFPHIQVRNEKQGFKELLRWAKTQGVNTKDTLFGLEFTGYYSDALEQFLTGKKLCYAMLPTTVVKHYQRGTRDKNDKTDSAKIADYLFRFNGTECIKQRVLPSKAMQELKALKSERKFYVQQRVACENRQNVAKSKQEQKHLQKAIDLFNEQIELIEQQMAEVVTSDEEIYLTYTRLLTIPGIGPVNAINTIANTQDFTAFETARQYAKYVGVAPSEHSSGTSVRWRGRPSPHADLQAKADLSMAAMRAVEFSCDMSIYYERKLGNRPNDKDVKRKALNAVKFQLIKMMFAVVRQDRVFEQRGLDKA
ncbi:MAG: transposase [Prevotella sp.]|jgi:transposase|nr:transposase [Prevotella sp.]